MKTTNYEISKQLEEAGFKGKADFIWLQDKFGTAKCFQSDFDPSYDFCYMDPIKSYDLETILETLPKNIEGSYLAVEFDPSESCIGYNGLYIAFMNKNESLADTAARLLLLLHKNNLI